MTDVYCAMIPLEHKPFVECPIFIDFHPDKLTDERTYMRIGTKPDTRKNDAEHIASIRILHPAGTVIDENNWAGFLYMDLCSQPNMRRDFPFGFDKYGCSAVYTKPSFGPYCFIIEGHDHLFGIVARRPPAMRLPERVINTATVIKSPNHKTSDGRVYYTSNYISFEPNRNKIYNTTLVDKYFARFRETIAPPQILSIYVDGPSGIPNGDDVFIEASSDQDLYFLPYEGFEYFKSGDGKVIFTIQSDPVPKAFAALKATLDKTAHAKSDRGRYLLIAEYYTLNSHTTDGIRVTLGQIIDEIERLNM